MTEFCGVGGSNAPVPGDPSLNSSVITAQAGDGGIAVSWTYPVVNPNALAYTELYRSTTSDFALASIIAQVGGSYHFDALYDEIGTQYFYWIKMVSFSGTRGDTMGPASATMQPTTARLIELLEGMISNTQLAQDLKTDITSISGVQSGLSAEAQLRLTGTTILTDMLEGLDQQLEDQGYLIVDETRIRTLNDSSVIASIDAKYLLYEGTFAGIAAEQLIQTGKNSAYAANIETLQATTTGPNGHASKIQETKEVLVGADGTSGVAANYMLKTSVSVAGQPPLIAGFGLYNDGATSDFIISADKFAVGKPGQTHSYPFIIADVNGQTQIALNARTLIPDAHITNAMIDNYIQSSNFNPTTGTGWRIDKGGNIEGNNIILRDNAGNVLFSAGGLAGNIPLSQLTSSNLVNSNTSWADVAGTSNAPANNATVGATWNGNISGYPGNNAVLNTNTTWSNVAGTANAPANNADVTASNTAAGIAAQGDFATLNKILGTNISTYIEAAAISSAYIKNAAVGTLKIGGQAVTVMVAKERTTLAILTGTGWHTILSKSITVTDALSTTAVIIGGKWTATNGSTVGFHFSFRVIRGTSTQIGTESSAYLMADGGNNERSSVPVAEMDQPGNGTHTYRLQAKCGGTNLAYVDAANISLMVGKR